jgi:hypothetical protein
MQLGAITVHRWPQRKSCVARRERTWRSRRSTFHLRHRHPRRVQRPSWPAPRERALQRNGHMLDDDHLWTVRHGGNADMMLGMCTAKQMTFACAPSLKWMIVSL